MARLPKFLTGFCLGAILIYLFYPENTTKQRTTRLVKYDRYIMPTYRTCSGIGNQMFRVAALYGIGKYTQRTPAMDASQSCQQAYMSEIKSTFPRFYDLVKLKDPHSPTAEKVTFGDDCCMYQDPTIIPNSDADVLVLSGNFFQSFKYFGFAKPEIIELFQFSEGVKLSAAKYARDLFGSDRSHKMCVHVRRGDFITDAYNLETKTEFLIPAMTSVHSHLRANIKIDETSVVFIGIDEAYLASLHLPKSEFKHIYRVNGKSRGEEMYFGTEYCDSILLTASGSTFGWWIAYLSPRQVPVYYNEKVSKVPNFSKALHPNDYFLPEWHKLSLNDGFISIN
uniref:O-fucosyltransferase family protein n=1 Tax=Panagrellus redivivus TaxID=6233 RepID=A0A7E4URC5_PANRE